MDFFLSPMGGVCDSKREIIRQLPATGNYQRFSGQDLSVITILKLTVSLGAMIFSVPLFAAQNCPSG
jgi:hypothetical protein